MSIKDTEVTRQQILRGGADLLAALVDFKAAYTANKPLKIGLIMPNYDQLRRKNADHEANCITGVCLPVDGGMTCKAA